MLHTGRFAAAAAAASLFALPAVAVEDHYVSAGRYFSFVVEQGYAAGVGRNQYGQLGLGDTVDRDALTGIDIEDRDIPENDTVLAIAAGAFHSLFILDNGDVFVAGRNNYGQLGIGSADTSDKIVATPLTLRGVKQVAAGYAHSLFLLEDGTVLASGLNSAGQLGTGSTNKFERELKAIEFPFNASLVKVVDIAAGYDFSYFRTDTGVLYAAGQNLGGQLGTGDKKSTNSPVESKTSVKSMVAGESHGLLLVDEQGIYVTGANFRGQIGGGDTSAPEAAWVHRTGDNAGDHEYKGVASVSAGGDSSCYARQSNRVYVYCMGQDSMGQIGVSGNEWDPSRDNYTATPTLMSTPDIDVIDDIALSEDHGIFVNFDEVLVTGSNSYGQLGSYNGTSFGPGLTTMQLMLEFGNRGTRPTPAPSPAGPAPSPGGTVAPGPSPSPDTTRSPNNDGDGGLQWEMLVLGAAVGLAVVLVLVGLGRNGDDEEREAGAAPATELAAGGESQA